MFSLREYLITVSQGMGSSIAYDEKWVHDNIQRVYAASLTWAKGMKIMDIIDVMFPKCDEHGNLLTA